jgi:hypothetical protein
MMIISLPSIKKRVLDPTKQPVCDFYSFFNPEKTVAAVSFGESLG